MAITAVEAQAVPILPLGLLVEASRGHQPAPMRRLVKYARPLSSRQRPSCRPTPPETASRRACNCGRLLVPLAVKHTHPRGQTCGVDPRAVQSMGRVRIIAPTGAPNCTAHAKVIRIELALPPPSRTSPKTKSTPKVCLRATSKKSASSELNRAAQSRPGGGGFGLLVSIWLLLVVRSL